MTNKHKDLFLYGMVVPIVPFILEDRIGIDPSNVQSATSGLLAAYAGASFVFAPVAGFIADRTSSRQGPFLAGLTALILATVLLFTGRSMAVLVIARVAQGASSAVVWTVGLALCIDTVGPENLGKTIGSIFSFISVGAFAAPVVGGTVWERSGQAGALGVSIGVISVDLLMRLLVIEKKVAKKYDDADPNSTSSEDTNSNDDQNNDNDEENGDQEHGENSPLLPSKDKEAENALYTLAPPDQQPRIYQLFPILLTFRSSSLLLAFLVALIQAFLLSSFDSTLPTHAQEYYGFDSLKSGLLFLPLGALDLVMGPIAGWATDKYGTKALAVIGYLWLVPSLALLRIPQPSPLGKNLAIYCVILALNGAGLATIGAPSIVEAGAVVDKFYKKNPENFPNSPYAQLYGFNSMIFSAGLALGPLVAGALKEKLGYGDANAVLAAVSGVTAVGCWVWLGGRPRGLGGKGLI